MEAVKSGRQIDKLLIKKGLQGDLVKELLSLVHQYKIPVQYLPIEGLNKITTKNHQGVIANLSLIEYDNIENIVIGLFELGKVPFILVLDGITDVRNFGAICRTAECAGVHAVIIPAVNSAQINADAIKASSGSLYHLSICRTDSLYQTVKFLKDCGLKIIGATEKGSQLYFKTDYNGPFALVLGSEYKGVSNQVLKLADELVNIPILGNVSSLNVSSAASVIIYEAVKQRMN